LLNPEEHFMLMNYLIKRWSVTSFALGAGAAAFGGALLRPVIVSAVKLGMDAKDLATQAYMEAMVEAASIKAQAEQARTAPSDSGVASALESIRSDLEKLREEVAAKPRRGG